MATLDARGYLAWTIQSSDPRLEQHLKAYYSKQSTKEFRKLKNAVYWDPVVPESQSELYTIHESLELRESRLRA